MKDCTSSGSSNIRSKSLSTEASFSEIGVLFGSYKRQEATSRHQIQWENSSASKLGIWELSVAAVRKFSVRGRVRSAPSLLNTPLVQRLSLPHFIEILSNLINLPLIWIALPHYSFYWVGVFFPGKPGFCDPYTEYTGYTVFGYKRMHGSDRGRSDPYDLLHDICCAYL